MFEQFSEVLTMAETQATFSLRPGRPMDAKACARVCYEAFGAIARQHNFPPDFPSVEVAADLMTMLLAHPRFFSVVAESGGEVVGSNFLDERSTVAGLGPITVDPRVQNRKIGRSLMQAALDRATERHCPGVRLLQTAYHTRSLALYTTLGFHPRESIACMQGAPVRVVLPGHQVRRATAADLEPAIVSARRSTAMTAAANCSTPSRRAPRGSWNMAIASPATPRI
jgi:predicted N-acetyltransferase YhbS